MARNGRRQGTGRSTPARPKAHPNRFHRLNGGARALVILGALAAAVGAHFLLWGAVFPALGEVVGRVPVISTVTGWLFGGAAFAMWGVVAVNQDTATPGTKKRLRVVAWSWSAVAVLCFPSGYADGIRLPVDFWAGVYASAYGLVLAPVAVGVVGIGWWLVHSVALKRKDGPTTPTVGWACVGYSVLLLVWGSTLLRL